MKEVRLHGRGGQGIVFAAEMLAKAFVSEGKHVASFPMFGVERRGAPVTAYLRFDDKFIREETQIYYPDLPHSYRSDHENLAGCFQRPKG
jgi:2-oxoacid:acceptor oxidoreductase gamma subunit (pyruvate/2-ketoisovalerate family)